MRRGRRGRSIQRWPRSNLPCLSAARSARWHLQWRWHWRNGHRTLSSPHTEHVNRHARPNVHAECQQRPSTAVLFQFLFRACNGACAHSTFPNLSSTRANGPKSAANPGRNHTAHRAYLSEATKPLNETARRSAGGELINQRTRSPYSYSYNKPRP